MDAVTLFYVVCAGIGALGSLCVMFTFVLNHYERFKSLATQMNSSPFRFVIWTGNFIKKHAYIFMLVVIVEGIVIFVEAFTRTYEIYDGTSDPDTVWWIVPLWVLVGFVTMLAISIYITKQISDIADRMSKRTMDLLDSFEALEEYLRDVDGESTTPESDDKELNREKVKLEISKLNNEILQTEQVSTVIYPKADISDSRIVTWVQDAEEFWQKSPSGRSPYSMEYPDTESLEICVPIAINIIHPILIESIKLDIAGELYESDWESQMVYRSDDNTQRFFNIPLDIQRGTRTLILISIIDGVKHLSPSFQVKFPSSAN